MGELQFCLQCSESRLDLTNSLFLPGGSRFPSPLSGLPSSFIWQLCHASLCPAEESRPADSTAIAAIGCQGPRWHLLSLQPSDLLSLHPPIPSATPRRRRVVKSFWSHWCSPVSRQQVIYQLARLAAALSTPLLSCQPCVLPTASSSPDPKNVPAEIALHAQVAQPCCQVHISDKSHSLKSAIQQLQFLVGCHQQFVSLLFSIWIVMLPNTELLQLPDFWFLDVEPCFLCSYCNWDFQILSNPSYFIFNSRRIFSNGITFTLMFSIISSWWQRIKKRSLFPVEKETPITATWNCKFSFPVKEGID